MPTSKRIPIGIIGSGNIFPAYLRTLKASRALRIVGIADARMAAAQARASGRPAVALSLADPHWRMAAVLRPDAFKTAPPPA